jgi:hypothetical protein
MEYERIGGALLFRVRHRLTRAHAVPHFAHIIERAVRECEFVPYFQAFLSVRFIER